MDGTIRYLWFGGLGPDIHLPKVRPLLQECFAVASLNRPRICVLATGSGDDDRQIANATNAFASLGCVVEHVKVFQQRDPEYRERLTRADMIWVCGGSTANLLALWRLHGIDTVIAECAVNGALLAGTSAGMNCWFQRSITWSSGDYTLLVDGLGWVNGLACPQADSQPTRYREYLKALGDGSGKGLALGEETAFYAMVADGLVTDYQTLSLGEPWIDMRL